MQLFVLKMVSNRKSAFRFGNLTLYKLKIKIQWLHGDLI